MIDFKTRPHFNTTYQSRQLTLGQLGENLKREDWRLARPERVFDWTPHEVEQQLARWIQHCHLTHVTLLELNVQGERMVYVLSGEATLIAWSLYTQGVFPIRPLTYNQICAGLGQTPSPSLFKPDEIRICSVQGVRSYSYRHLDTSERSRLNQTPIGCVHLIATLQQKQDVAVCLEMLQAELDEL